VVYELLSLSGSFPSLPPYDDNNNEEILLGLITLSIESLAHYRE